MTILLVATIVILGAILVFKLFHSNQRKVNYWDSYGIRQVDTSAAYSFLDTILQKKSVVEANNYAYKVMGDAKFCGLVEMGLPVIQVKDVDLVKKVMIKDCVEHFTDRRQFFSEQDVMARKMLPFLQGEEWKGVRTAVTPTFTTGKIRRMMTCFNSVGKEWVDELKCQANSTPEGSVKINVLSSVNTYTVDVIASAVFGMSAGTVKNPKSTFATMANRLSDNGLRMVLKFTLNFLAPSLYKWLQIKFLDQGAMNFFVKILEQGLKSRMKGETKGNDFLQLLVEARKGELKAESVDELSAFEKDALFSSSSGVSEKKQYLTDDIMNAQSLVFFFAGFSTTTNLIAFVFYFLAAHQDIQGRLRREVASITKEDGGFDYDDLGKLVYLDMIVCETNRHFPAAARIERMCVKEYKDPKSGLFVPKGTLVYIPVIALHNDEKYYEYPDKFYPEHFTPEKKAVRVPYVYLPFGMGPRNCIGMRFALTESKAAIAHVVSQFRIEPTEKTVFPVHGIGIGIQYVPPKNLELKLTPLRN